MRNYTQAPDASLKSFLGSNTDPNSTGTSDITLFLMGYRYNGGTSFKRFSLYKLRRGRAGRTSATVALQRTQDLMKTHPWAVMLTAVQLLIAVSLWLYQPFQFESEMVHRVNLVRSERGLPPLGPHPGSLGLGPDDFARFYPPPSGRVLNVVNFPASTLSGLITAHVHGTTPAWRMDWEVETLPNRMQLFTALG